MILEPTTIAVCAVLGVAAFFKSITGFGFSLCAAPLLTVLVAPPQAVPVLVLVETGIGICLWSRLKVSVEPRQLTGLSLAALLGMIAGTALLTALNVNILRILIGAIVLATTVVLWIGRRLVLHQSRMGIGIVGGLSGLFGGTTAMSGPPIVLFYDATTENPSEFRAHCIAFFTVTYAAQSLWLAWNGLIIAETLKMSGLGLGIAIFVFWISRGWHERIDSSQFRKLCFALLSFSGAAAIGFGVAGWLGY